MTRLCGLWTPPLAHLPSPTSSCSLVPHFTVTVGTCIALTTLMLFLPLCKTITLSSPEHHHFLQVFAQNSLGKAFLGHLSPRSAWIVDHHFGSPGKLNRPYDVQITKLHDSHLLSFCSRKTMTTKPKEMSVWLRKEIQVRSC